jgi:hypothetical protein
MTTPAPTDADVERVARAIMVASNAFGEMWIDPVAIARAAIAAMPGPDAARVRELEDALRAERERCAQIAESQTLAEQTTWTQAGAHVARVIREGET